MPLLQLLLRILVRALRELLKFLTSPQAFCLYIGGGIFLAGFHLFGCIYTLVLLVFSMLLPRP